MRRRISRIVPLHYLTSLVYVLFIARDLLSEKLWSNALVHMLFIHNWFPSLHGAINGVNWSLGTEMQFYLLMIIAAPWVRIARWWTVGLIFIGTAWLWRYGVTLFVPSNGPLGVFLPFVVSTQLPGMLDEFVVGLLLARFVKSEQGIMLLSRMSSVKERGIVVLLAGVTTWAVLSLFWRHASFWDNPYMVTCFRTLLAVDFALILLVSCSLNAEKWLFISSPLRYLGIIFYGIYLWHLPVLLSWKKVTWLTAAQALPLILICTISLSITSWHFLERPLMIRYGKKMNPSVKQAH